MPLCPFAEPDSRPALRRLLPILHRGAPPPLAPPPLGEGRGEFTTGRQRCN